ncbi:MAG: signal peptidase I [Anaerolineae bacterium]|nr:signal peptidase I [Anaerolineae bacterium]
MEEQLPPEESQFEELPAEIEPAEIEIGEARSREARLSLAHTFGIRSALRETLETVLLAALLILLLNATTGRFRVHGPSMEPTLRDGQYIIVSKVVYLLHPPERGDVIVFRLPDNPGEDYVKRIIGLPGEYIEMQNGTVLVNGKPLDEPYVQHPGFYSGTWTLGENEYFVLGDNRLNSSDSRTWGVFSGDHIVGKAWLCYWPPEDWGMVRHYAFAESEP